MTGVARNAVVLIQEDAVIVAVYCLLDVDIGVADIVNGPIFCIPVAASYIKAVGISPVRGVHIDYRVVLIRARVTRRKLRYDFEHTHKIIPDPDIKERDITAVGDHDSPVTRVSGYAVVFIQENAVIVAVYRLLDVNAREEDVVCGPVFVIPGGAERIITLDIRPVCSIFVDYRIVVVLHGIARAEFGYGVDITP